MDFEEEDEEDEEEEVEGEEEEKKVSSKPKPKAGNKSRVAAKNLNLEEYKIVEKIENQYDLNKFDMNKVLDSEDEVNKIKRKPRNAEERGILKPW